MIPFLLFTILDALQTVVRQQLTLLQRIDKLMATQAEFDARLKKIDDNTTASAAAAQAIKKAIDDLKVIIAGGGVPAPIEAQLLARLDVMGNTSEALAKFLQETATGAVEPAPVPVPVVSVP